jgi:hypothetical protein
MPVRSLPSNPNLNHLKYQAKDLLKGHAARNLEVAQRIREFHPHFKNAPDAEIFSTGFTLGSAQLTIAREHGFRSWARLEEHVEKPVLSHSLHLPHHERIEDSLFHHAVDLLDAGDTAGLRAHLKHHPDLVRQHVVFEGGNYFRNPTLLEFVAENPIRHGTLPGNIVEIAEIILEAGAERSALNEALGLICSGRVPRKCRVQLPLIDLLCDHGADPNIAIETAVVHGEFEAVNALIRRGAQMNLPVAAALGNTRPYFNCIQVPAMWIAIGRLPWHHSLATLRSFDLCLMRARIQTGTTQLGSIPIRHQFTRLRWPAMTNSFGFSLNAVQESI